MFSDERLKVIAGHLFASNSTRGTSPYLIMSETAGSEDNRTFSQEVKSAVPKSRTDLLKWNGWGYKDSKFVLNKNDIIEFTGSRYAIGQQELPYFTEWVVNKLNVNLYERNTPKEMPKEFPPPQVPQELTGRLGQMGAQFTVEGMDRLIRSHGQTLHDIYDLRCSNQLKRIPDIVVWPDSHGAVQRVVQLADELNVVVIPYGGGTSVSGSVSCPQDEQRTILVLDTSQMNRLLWLNEDNLTACFESGVLGQDLERELQVRGYTCGHEPDSYEFSRSLPL